MEKFDPNKLTEEEIQQVVRLYYSKWRKRNKDRIRYYNVEYYKKCKGIKKSVVPNSVNVGSVVFNNII
jgi:hypothetical protein